MNVRFQPNTNPYSWLLFFVFMAIIGLGACEKLQKNTH